MKTIGVFLILILPLVTAMACGSDENSNHGPEPIANRDPVITSFTCNPDRGASGMVSDLYCDAYDPDGDSLTYYCAATEGTISTDFDPSCGTWYGPLTGGTYRIEVVVRDGRGGEDTAYRQITIEEEPGPSIPPLKPTPTVTTAPPAHFMLPDLVIWETSSSPSGDVGPEYVQFDLGTSLRIGVDVKNVGNAPANNFRIRFIITRPDGAYNIEYSDYIYLQPGETVHRNFAGGTLAWVGLYKINIMVDPDNSVIEQVEEGYTTVQTPQGPLGFGNELRTTVKVID